LSPAAAAREIRFVQVKSGSARLSELEREKLEQVKCPPAGRVEVWSWTKKENGRWEATIEVV
jgi:hypothetical protein